MDGRRSPADGRRSSAPPRASVAAIVTPPRRCSPHKMPRMPRNPNGQKRSQLPPVAVLFSSFAFACFLSVPIQHCRGDEVEARTVLPVWPDGGPGVPAGVAEQSPLNEKGHVTRVTHPTLTLMEPPEGKANGTSVIICPGGGYHILAIEKEGYAVGRWLNSHGVTAWVLRYRVPRTQSGPFWRPPLQDAQRAVSMVRHQAADRGLDPDRVGILGFSAGGHLSATTSTRHEERAYDSTDEIDKVSCRPDFAVLVYPAYITPSKSDLDRSEEITVTTQTPPTFITVAADDGHALSSLRYTIELRKHSVPVELHVFPDGGHGYGLGRANTTANHWPELCRRWMAGRGLLAPPSED